MVNSVAFSPDGKTVASGSGDKTIKLWDVAVYRSPGPHAVSPTFETKFARMEYVGNAKFALSFQRRTGEWVELYDALSVDECLKAIRDGPWFQP